MKNMIKKNKVLFLAMAIALVCGACLAVVLISQANTAMAAEQIVTAEAESAETPDVTAPAVESLPEATEKPQATAVNTTLSAEALSFLVEMKERRRDCVIPGFGNTVVNEADTWENEEPENFETLKGQALPKAAEFAKALFGYDVAEDNVNFQYYSDTSGHRGDIIKVVTRDEAVVCTLAADTLELIEIDYYFIPASPAEENFDFEKDPNSGRGVADSIAVVFGTTVSDIYPAGGGGGRGIWMTTYATKMANGKLANFAIMNDTLYAVGVYPSEAAQQENVYFDADVQMGQVLASPQDFKKGQPGAGDMTQEEAQGIYEKFLTLAGSEGKHAKPKMTFYIDNSGKRENYWHMEGKQLTMDLSSKSKWIISLICDSLYNPKYDLTKIGYDAMGGQEYADYVSNIMSQIYGSGFKSASNNAVYDYHYCTEDAWMTDGSVYEFMFEDGKLQQVFFYADEECFRASLAGWKADHEYINAATGETFIPN